jgi:hypothetical protein
MQTRKLLMLLTVIGSRGAQLFLQVNLNAEAAGPSLLMDQKPWEDKHL